MHFTPQRLGIGGLCALLLAGFLAAPPVADAQTTVRFQDKTAATGLSVKSDPTDVSALEASADDLLDLEIHYSFNSGNTADFFGSRPLFQGLPLWNNDSGPFYGSSRPGPGTEAPISLDYDNDGLTDALVNEPAALKLFRGTGRSFVDVTSSASLVAGGEAVAAADYDGDGWTDIATAYGAQVDLWKNLGVNAAGNHLGFANDGLLFTHVASAGAMTWLDIDADGDMDLFIADQSGGPAGFNGSRNTLLINGGAGPSSFALATLPGQLEQANLTTSVAVADVLFDVGSYYPEIVLGGADPELYRNNSGTLQYKSTAGTSSIGGVRVLDFDLDGKLDILHFGGATAPPVLRHQGASEGFTDAASTVGLTTSGVLAGVTADFDADGDVDVFQADPAASNPKLFLESWDTSQCPNPPCGAGQDDPANSWVEITLQGQPYGAYLTDKTTNTDLVGTRVSMLTGPALWVQGNAGASSAPGMPLVFADVGV